MEMSERKLEDSDASTSGRFHFEKVLEYKTM